MPSKAFPLHCALVAILAFAGLGAAASASANGFDAEAFPVTFKGAQKEAASIEAEGGLLKVSCKVATLTSAAVEVATASESLAFAPSYSECTSLFGAATVTTTGCQYVLHAGSETGTGEFSGTADISCEKEAKISIATGTCEAQIGSQTGLGGITFHDELEASPPRFTAAISLSKVKYTVTKDGFGCPFAGLGAKENGILKENESVTGSTGVSSVGVHLNKDTMLCTVKEDPCNNAFIGESIEAAAANTTFKEAASEFEVKCELASLQMRPKAIAGNPRLAGTVESLTWGTCANTELKSCRVEVQPGVTSAVEFTSNPLPAQFGNGGFVPYPVKIEIDCIKANFLCKFGTAGVAGALDGGAPPKFRIRSELKAEGKCSIPNVLWEAEYTASNPKALYSTFG